MIEIDLPRAVELVLACIAEKPEGFKYRDYPQAAIHNCRNVFVDGGDVTPACLIGSAVVKAGIPAEDLLHISNVASYDLFADLDDKIYATRAALSYFATVQTSQDNGETWIQAHMHGLYRASLLGHLNATEEVWIASA